MRWNNINPAVDAFTGGPVLGDQFKCQKCGSIYGRESVNQLVANNLGRCISCEAQSVLLDINEEDNT